MNFDTTIGIIFLGASNFSKSKELSSSSAFESSYKQIKSHFFNNQTYNIIDVNCLDLFDSELAPNDQDAELRSFLNSRINDGITDLIFYYVGHGCFDSRQGFILALKSIEDDNKALSGLLFRNLANRVSRDASNIRSYFILDCCFSGEAAPEFQATPVSIIEKQFIDEFPESGTTMMCSSSRDLPSIIVTERNITMFSESLERALTMGNKAIANRFLTLRELCETTFRNIKRLNPGKEVRPEVHSPVQDGGDIASRIRLFPNQAIFEEPFNIKDRAHDIRKLLINNDFLPACKLLMDFILDFDLKHKYETDVIILVAQCRDLEDNRNKLDRDKYLKERRNYYVEILELIKSIELQNV